ncbi:MAG: hypothetical protein ABI858_03450, partial [Pseudoxanthomonas sp.]
MARWLRVLVPGSVFYLFVCSVQFLLWPTQQDVARIYDFSVLMGFEFILNPLGLMLFAFSRWWLGKVGVLLFFSGFILAFQMMLIDASTMTYLVAGLLLSHFVIVRPVSEEEGQRVLGIYAGRIMLYFFALMFCAMASSLLPPFGLDQPYLDAVDYDGLKKHGGLMLDQPHISMWIGVLYFGGISVAY